MKKIRQITKSNGIFLASLLFVVMIILPQLLTGNRPISAEEQAILSLTKNIINTTQLRAAIFCLVIINTTLIYKLFSSWMSKRRAGLSIFILASIPIWLIMQITLPKLSIVMLPLLVALWSFNQAGLSNRPTGWYTLSGFTTTAAWILEPIGTSIIIALGVLLLVAVKPHYAKHIARQSSLILIILFGVLGLISLAAWRFNFSGQAYIVSQLNRTITVTLLPKTYWVGPHSFYIGLPGMPIIPVAIMALGSLGAWQLFTGRKRPRNIYLLVLPITLGVVALQLSGYTSLMLLYIAMTGIAAWAVMGAQYLHNSWKKLFPHNKLAGSVGDGLVALMLASLIIYSFWYVNRAWSGNPGAQAEAKIEWNKQL